MNPNEPSNHVSTHSVDEIKRQRRKRLENAITPRGSGSGVRREQYARPSDFELKHCDFKKWARYDSLPIEQACFVLLGFEPPPLHVLRFQQDTYNPSHEPTWDKPPEYDDALRSLGVSIKHGNISTTRIIEHSYETQHVCWPELIQWARSKSYPIPLELESIVANTVPAVLAVTVPKPVSDATESASGGVQPPKWDKWRHMRDVEIWEAVALSLNLDPDKLPVYLRAYDKYGDDPFRICPPQFLERLLVVNSNCGKSFGFKPVHNLKARCLVDLPEFAAWALKLSIPDLPPELMAMALIEPTAASAQNTATHAPVTVGDGSAKRIAKKLSIETVAIDYMRKAYKAGQFESAAKFHKHLIKTAGVPDSPFEMGTGQNSRKLFCPAASSFYDVGTLGKIWAKIRDK